MLNRFKTPFPRILFPLSCIRYPASGIWYQVYGILIFFLLFTNITSAQKKYFIYFKDKGIRTSQILSKDNINEGLRLLSEKSIKRRIKNMGENFVTYEDLPVKEEYIRIVKGYGVKINRILKWFNAVSAFLTEEQNEQISSLNFIEKVEPVIVLKKRNSPEHSGEIDVVQDNTLTKDLVLNEINYGLSFTQLNVIDIPQVHSRGITGEGVVVGFLDTGFDWKDHESLNNAGVIAEYDFVFDDTVTANEREDSQSQHNHGTSVLSTAGGFKDSIFIGGTYNSRFILAKTEDIRSETRVEEDNYAAALEWMDSIGVDITSSSLGYSEFNDPEDSYTYEDMDGKTTIVTRAAELAFERGIVTITAAGNEGNSTWGFITAPGDGFNTIAVGAVTSTNLVASFSSYGPTSDGRIKPDIVAQGTQVIAANPSRSDSYTYQQGTSLATPFASSAAALLLSAHPHLLNSQVRSILLKTADNSRTPDNDRGYGLVSASKAISFPNIEKTGSRYVLHKIFIDKPDINPSSVQINYFSNGQAFTESMSYDGSLKYMFELPVFGHGETVNFYFTYSDSSGAGLKEPLEETYQIVYGNLEITSSSTTPVPPSQFYLEQNFPNPFPSPSNPSTTIFYYIPEDGFVSIKIFDILGNEVLTAVNQVQQRGRHSVIVNSAGLSSGVYFYRLQTGMLSWIRKMIVLK